MRQRCSVPVSSPSSHVRGHGSEPASFSPARGTAVPGGSASGAAARGGVLRPPASGVAVRALRFGNGSHRHPVRRTGQLDRIYSTSDLGFATMVASTEGSREPTHVKENWESLVQLSLWSRLRAGLPGPDLQHRADLQVADNKDYEDHNVLWIRWVLTAIVCYVMRKFQSLAKVGYIGEYVLHLLHVRKMLHLCVDRAVAVVLASEVGTTNIKQTFRSSTRTAMLFPIIYEDATIGSSIVGKWY
ncbi:hypothetical protein EJB05_27687, partial [Eragrostis curvula]